MVRPLLALALVALAVVAGGCGGGDGGDGAPTPSPPVLGEPAPRSEDRDAAAALGFPGFATKNTTRVGGADPVANAAGVALAAYPDTSRAGRPAAAVLIDIADWRGAISAAQLAARPLRFPILFSDGAAMPEATASALEALAPLGSTAAGDAQLVRVGRTARPEGMRSRDLDGRDAPTLARALDRLATTATERASRAVIVAPADAPAFAMPAAGLAAHTGAPVLWTQPDELPAATRQAIESRENPRIYVVGPSSAISEEVSEQLAELGRVRRIQGPDPVRNAIAVARFSDGGFGWNVTDPGHGLVFASADRPADAAAAALLSSTGKFGPLLLLSDATGLPGPVEEYLLDIQPGYDRDPVRGVYNHGWIMGDDEAVAGSVQAKIDGLLEIQPIDTGNAPSS
jgi:hypothetical protein